MSSRPKETSRRRGGLLATVGFLAVAYIGNTAVAGPAPTISMSHVFTAAYVGRPRDTRFGPAALRKSLTWASTTWQASKKVQEAGIKTMFYLDPNRQQPKDPLYIDDDSAFAHDCGGQRIKSKNYENQFLFDPSSTAVTTQLKKRIEFISKGAHWDAFFLDDVNSLYALDAIPCGYDPRAWLEATKQQIQRLGVPIIYNGLQEPNQMYLNSISSVIGGMYEGCYADATTRPRIWDQYWTKIENVELGMAADKKLFFCLGRDSTSAAEAQDGRIYTLASFLLSYAQDSGVLWESYPTPSGYMVQPESQLVPLQPLRTNPKDISALKTSTGAYGREYRACYFAGSYVGGCAMVVNPDRNSAHDFPYGSKYAHTLILSGGGILDGGSASLVGPPPPSSVPPLGAVVAFYR